MAEFRNFSIYYVVPDPAILKVGDYFRVVCQLEYQGEFYTTAKIYAAIGTRGVGFNEILASQVTISVGPNATWWGYVTGLYILITSAIAPGTNYDLYAKLINIPGADLYSYKDNIITIAAPVEPTFQNFAIGEYIKV